MSPPIDFEDYDFSAVYNSTQDLAARHEALNFVLEFGAHASKIASNVHVSQFRELVDGTALGVQGPPTPARWINFWRPGKQREAVEILGRHYGFSPRLVQLLCTAPPDISDKLAADVPPQSKRPTSSQTGDIERGEKIASDDRKKKPMEHNFFDIARSFKSYQSIDIGEKFICIGANWMQPVPDLEGGHLERIWCWFVLCNDGTVISFHEDPVSIDPRHLSTVRTHFLRVLRQLSEIGRKQVEGTEVLALRYPPESQSTVNPSASESASNLLYYLFDNWASTILILKSLRSDLALVSDRIIAGLDPVKKEVPASLIIPKLNEIGKQIRSNQHLYRGYENLIARILEFKERAHHHAGDDSVKVALSACYRFERLRDHIRFLVLNYLDEAIGEKDGLFTTYFNITTQKDSQATTKLSQSAATLSKLGVLFLPVSLMTGYFSIQIQELEGVYTVKTYWVSFAIVMVLSFLALFMFSNILVGMGSRIDRFIRRVLHIPQ